MRTEILTPSIILAVFLFEIGVRAQSTTNDSSKNVMVISSNWAVTDKIIKDNKTIKVWFEDFTYKAGKLHILSDSTIALNKDTILLENIEQIRTSKYADKLAGTSLLALSSVPIFGIAAFLDPYCSCEVMAFLSGITAIALISSATYVIINGRKYTMSDGWKLSIEEK